MNGVRAGDRLRGRAPRPRRPLPSEDPVEYTVPAGLALTAWESRSLRPDARTANQKKQRLCTPLLVGKRTNGVHLRHDSIGGASEAVHGRNLHNHERPR